MPSDKEPTHGEQNHRRRQELPLSTPGAVSGAADINMTPPCPARFQRRQISCMNLIVKGCHGDRDLYPPVLASPSVGILLPAPSTQRTTPPINTAVSGGSWAGVHGPAQRHLRLSRAPLFNPPPPGKKIEQRQATKWINHQLNPGGQTLRLSHDKSHAKRVYFRSKSPDI